MTSQQEKKQVLLTEISFWKDSKLLPEYYCDFLTSLYSEGNKDEETIRQEQALLAEKRRKERRQTIFYAVSLAITLALVVLMFLFQGQLATIALSVGAAILVGFISMIFYTMKKYVSNTLKITLLYASCALLLFGLTVRLTLHLLPNNDEALIGILLLNCFIWLISGLKLKLYYFTFAGLIGLLIVIGYAFIF